jgi:transcriptional regulator with XRE-family HTH domain
MSALGAAFRTAREAQGLTLSDVSERIHIRPAYLAAIESEDWKTIGPPVYIRGFLRSYARCLGLDGDAAVASFSDEAATKPAPAPTFPQTPRSQAARGDTHASSHPSLTKPKKGLSGGAIAAMVVALGLVLFVAYEYFDYKLGEPVALNDARPPLASAEPSAQLRPPAPGSGSRARASDGVALRLADSSWLRVVIDGKVAMEGTFPKGTARRFLGRSATVRVGNAGGVDISIDGKDLGPMGGLGDVAERSFQL